MSSFKQKLKRFVNSSGFRKAVAKTISMGTGAVTLLVITGVTTAVGVGIGAAIGGFGAVGGLGIGVTVGTALGAYVAPYASGLVESLMQSYLDGANNQEVVNAPVIDTASTIIPSSYEQISNRVSNGLKSRGYPGFFSPSSQKVELDEDVQMAIAVQASFESYHQEHGAFANKPELEEALALFQAADAERYQVQPQM